MHFRAQRHVYRLHHNANCVAGSGGATRLATWRVLVLLRTRAGAAVMRLDRVDCAVHGQQALMPRTIINRTSPGQQRMAAHRDHIEWLRRLGRLD